MKKLSFLALVAAGMLFGACSSDKDDVSVIGPDENGGGNYLAIRVNLPTVSNHFMTRADNTNNVADDNNDQVTYKDGLDTEWEVKDATLLIFENSSEKFIAAYDLSHEFTQTGNTEDNVTSYSEKYVVKVSGSVKANDLMLVVLNRNSLFSYNTDNTVTVNGTKFSSSNTYTNFQSALTQVSELGAGTMHSASGGFYMANAPLANLAGSGTSEPTGANVRVLVPITNVYGTETEARASTTVDQIYVERGMAKVTVESSTGSYTNSKMGGTKSITWTVDSWTLDNTNKKSYLVRSTEGHSGFLGLKSNSTTVATAPVYRYIGNAQISFPSAQTYGYRTYFAKDPNYDTDASSELSRVTSSTVFQTTFGDDYPQYCFENTFTVANQNVNQTTLVQLSTTTTYKVGESDVTTDLYTLNGNRSIIYDGDGIKGVIAEAAANYLIANKATYVKTGEEGSISSSDITVTLDASVNAGTITATKLTPTGSTKTSLTSAALNSDDLIDAIVTAVNTAVGTVVKYKNGKSYYHIRIKHFGDNLTPWNNGETPTPGLTGGVYPSTNRDGNYLGRYGVLRNNWYNLKVNSIRALGEPNPVTTAWPSTPDDELDTYVVFQINVLSWAKRPTQNADL